MAHMTLEQKIGQHFMGHIPRAGLNPALLADIGRGLYGGFILYPWNYTDDAGVRSLTSSLEHAASEASPPIDLFISVDQEGGRVAAFRFPDFVQFPPQFTMGRYGDAELGWAEGYIVGVELRSLGINMNFAPVLGLYPKADSTIIGDRSYGPDPQKVAAIGKAYILGAEASGIIPVAKHFPGHGAAHMDSHYDLPIVELSERRLLDNDIVPFKAAVDVGVEAIMTAHVLFPKVDPSFPATLSDVFLKQILRKELGFNGLIISDGLSMGALKKHYSLTETLERAFDAGVDILLANAEYDVPALVVQTEALVRSGKIPLATVNDGTRRILELKLRHGLLTHPAY